MNTNTYVCMLPEQVQMMIIDDILTNVREITVDLIEDALNSRLCDLEEIIDIKK